MAVVAHLSKNEGLVQSWTDPKTFARGTDFLERNPGTT